MSPKLHVFVYISILFIFTLLHVRASPANPITADPASTLPNIPLTIDPGFTEPLPKTGLLEAPPDCFTQPRSAGPPHHYPFQRAACVELVFRLVTRQHSTLPFEWDPKTMPFPVKFQLGTCAISVYSGAGGMPDVFSVIAVARVAGLIISQCAKADGEYLGGRMEIGARNAFWVAVSGNPR
ncbi:MAG: hypothetical protein LQ337_008862 [Flavoplaca oasis]|nr:MAG: hypothetical protein LQ337_008862 [Flavoplaca oasis]